MAVEKGRCTMQVTERLEQFRSLMRTHGLDACVVPSTDPHQSEYVADTWQRRAFISGFDGSAGTVVITLTDAGLWTDSRYFLQAEQQLAGTGIELFRMGEPGVPELEDWLCTVLKAGDRVGADPAVFSISAYEKLETALAGEQVSMRASDQDLVEAVWGEQRPQMPSGTLRVHPVEYAGVSVSDKLRRLQGELSSRGLDAHVVSALDDVAWLLNLRGCDVDFNPVFISYVVVEREEATLYVDMGKLTREVRAALSGVVEARPYESLGEKLVELGMAGARVWLDPASTSQQVAAALEIGGAQHFLGTGPVPAWKAAKNEVEIAGMRACHVRDGVAMVRFLHWLEHAVPAGGQSELSVADRLARFREEDDLLVGMSFGTISGYGPHGAIVHYSADEESNLELLSGNLLLVDSGGQYADGTTDITRTMALGSPSDEQRLAYTSVLKGHLLLGRSLFAAGTNGYQLDVLARAPLWAEGLNYGHGTGHGVGAHLCVHEGPFSVSLRGNVTPLEPGHILSNEPGFYKTGGYGIRVENLVLVVKKRETESGVFLGFENLTMCPYDRNLIDLSRLSPEDRAQIDSYHSLVYETLGPLLDGSDRAWLERATAAL